MATKDFDCVKFQRKRRAELSEEYNADPEKFKEELSKFRTAQDKAEVAKDK